MTAPERWRPVVGWENFYEVSDWGRVRSLDRVVSQRSRWGREMQRRYQGQILNPKTRRYGHQEVILSGDGERAMKDVHQMVLESFVGPRPEGMEACHNNGRGQDNWLHNLRWDTHRSNVDDIDRHGHRPRGTDLPHAKLTIDDVRHIRASSASGASLARSLGVSTSLVSLVRLGRIWRHVV